MATKKQDEFQSYLKKAFAEAENEVGLDCLPSPRNVTILLRLLLVQYDHTPNSSECILTICKYCKEFDEILQEGVPLRIIGTTSTQGISVILTTVAMVILSRLLIRSPYQEIDTIGLVVLYINEIINGDRSVDTVYLTDFDGCLLIIKIWEGLKSLALEGVVKAGCLVAISNLQYQGGGGALGHRVETVTDCIVFSQKPSEKHLIEGMSQLRENLASDINDLLQTMLETIRDLH